MMLSAQGTVLKDEEEAEGVNIVKLGVVLYCPTLFNSAHQAVCKRTSPTEAPRI